MMHLRILVPSLALLAACGGGDSTGPASAPRAITLSQDTVRVGALLQLRVTGMALTRDTVSGSLGGTATMLARSGDSTLALVAPQVAAGTQALRVVVGGDTLNASISVLPALAIADPVGSITAVLESHRDAMPREAPVGTDPAAWALEVARADSLVDLAETEVAGLEPADQLALARLLASAGPGPTAASRAPLAIRAPSSPRAFIFKDGECGDAQAALAGSGIPLLYSVIGLVIFIEMPPVNPWLKYGGTATMAAALATSLLVTKANIVAVGLACNVQKSVDLSTTPLDQATLVAASPLGQVSGATTPRFFRGRARTFYPVGDFRALSTLEAAQDSRVAKTATLLDDLNDAFARATSKLPSAIARLLPAPPPRLGAPGAARQLAIPAAGVRIENVRPSAVQLALSASGESITLTTTSDVTDDVPFSYDVVSTYDPTVKVTKSGVARPYMSATVAPYPATATGTRTVTTDSEGRRVGTLSCGGQVEVIVKGGDVGEWGTFAWTISGPGSLSESKPIVGPTGQPVRFESGSHAFGGSWFWSWTENGEAVFKPFTVTVNISYTDLLTGEAKAVPAISFNCT